MRRTTSTTSCSASRAWPATASATARAAGSTWTTCTDEDDDEDDREDDRDRAALEDGDDDLLDDDRAHDDDRDDLGAARPAQAWAGVVAQWLAGAVAGAVLWVLFRYLWRELPVVALAAAVLVTAGLVLLVRQLLHDVDRRTTGFAVLVGLLLTASPAVLVLLGR